MSEGHVLKFRNESLFVFDFNLRIPLVVDTGATVSVMPRKLCSESIDDPKCELKSASGHLIPTVGSVVRSLDLGVDIQFSTPFVVANVKSSYAYVGLDFLSDNKIGFCPDRDAFVHWPSNQKLHTVRSKIDHFSLSQLETKFLSLRRRTSEDTAAISLWRESDDELDTLEAIHAFSLGNGEVSSDTRLAEEECHKILTEFPDLTKNPDYSQPPKHDFKLDIELTNKTPILFKPRRCAPAERRAIRENFDSLENKGALKKGSSRFASPLTVVTKKNGSYRVCVDYVKLNERTIDLNFPLPLIDTLKIRITQHHNWFSVLDLREAYHSIPLTDQASQYAGIVTLDGFYLPKRMMFGLKNAPMKFCEFINKVVSGLESFVFSYLDDFLIFSTCLEDHYKHLRVLLQRFQEYGLFINSEKCVFARHKVTFLGFEVSSLGSKPIDDKITEIQKMERPYTLKQLRRFLGMVNYYRSYLPNLAEIVFPLTNLLKGARRPKRSPIDWNPEHQKAYLKALALLQNTSLLAHDDVERPVILSTDASLTHAGAVLEQLINPDDIDESSGTRPLCFYSKAFPSTTRERSTFNRELTAVFMAVRYFKYRIRGRKLVIRTDHLSLIHAIRRGTGEHSVGESRMIQIIKEYQPIVKHIDGESNAVADMLSRPNNVDSNVSKATQTAEVEMFSCHSLSMDSEPDLLSLELIATRQEAEPNCLVEAARISELTIVRKELNEYSPHLTMFSVQRPEDDTLKPIIPESLRALVFHTLHDKLHQGPEKSCDLIATFYYWPSMHNDIQYWTRCCPQCQKCKVTRHNRQLLQSFPSKPPRLRFVHADICGPFEESNGFKYILSVKDRATGFLITIPLSNRTTKSVLHGFSTQFVGILGVPNCIVTDNGAEFTSHAFEEFCASLGIEHRNTTTYHPACNGAVERVHRTLKVALRALQESSLWSEHLPLITLMINNQITDCNTYTPYQHTFGQPSNLPGAFVYHPETSEAPQEISKTEGTIFCDVMRFYNRSSRPLLDRNPFIEKDLFQCDEVLVRIDAIKPALAERYRGPYEVINRYQKYFTLCTEGGPRNISVDRLKVFHRLPPCTSDGLIRDSEDAADDAEGASQRVTDSD